MIKIVVAIGGIGGHIYIVELDENFEVKLLKGHHRAISSVKFATENTSFNYENVLLSCAVDESFIL